jgi:hypothetical protein
VEFDDAAASSLGSRYQALHRRILRICLETSNKRWVIPFTQITVHHAD